VFKDDDALQKAVAEVPQVTQPFGEIKSFGDTFKTARAEGKSVFSYDKGMGKGLEKFTTALKEEPPTDHKALPNIIGDREQVRSQLRRGAYKASLQPMPSILPIKAEAPAPTVVESLEEAGIKIDYKQLTADIGTEIQDTMIPGAVAVKDVLEELGLGDAIVTSGKRVKGKSASFHEIGLGMDFSLRNVKTKEQREELYKELTARLPAGFQIDRNDMFPKKGSKIIPHIHIEFDTAESKATMRKAFKAGLK
jgi:hypothetical protein